MIYFDHHAATEPLPAVITKMREAESVAWANPSSIHKMGQAARRLLDEARRNVASGLSADPNDVVFTSGGTEAVHLALHGASLRPQPRHVVTCDVEHPAVSATIKAWEADGTRVTRLAVHHGAAPDAHALGAAINDDTDLVAIQWVNHETGNVFPVAEYALVCVNRGKPLVVDATQAFGKVPVDAGALGADALIVAGHKMGGPPGIGAVITKRGVDLRPTLLGGAQERGRRAGTPDVVRAVGFGIAAQHAGERVQAMAQIGRLRDRMEAGLIALGAIVNGDGAARVATATNVSIQEKLGSLVVAAMDLEGICISSGAACSSGVAEASPVLLAMYPNEPWRASSALRLSFGPSNTIEEVDTALRKFAVVLPRIQKLA